MRSILKTLIVSVVLATLTLAGAGQAIDPTETVDTPLAPGIGADDGHGHAHDATYSTVITGGAEGADPATAGAWSAPFDAEVPAINMILLNDGRILYWSGLEADPDSESLDWIFFNDHPLAGQSRVLDLSGAEPSVITPSSPDGAGADLFCSGMTILPDGRVITAGGSEWHDLFIPEAFLDGSQHTRTFDPQTNTWTRVNDMINWRWYPSVISTPDGDAIAASGIFHLTKPDSMVTDIEVYDDETDDWDVLEGGDNLLPLYPRVSYVPGGPLKGDLFYNTVATMWGPFGEHPLEARWSLQQTFDPDTETWRDLMPSVFGVRQHGASVMLPLSADNGYAPTFATFGGALYRSPVATQFTEINDLSTDPPTNSPAESMKYPRWHLNGVLLPDGKVLAVGGGLYDNVYIHGQENVPILPAEIFDPETGEWTEMAAMEVPRMYHSTSVLLPDGRVLVGGHVPLPNPWPQMRDPVGDTGLAINPQTYETRMEIYSPPYLFRGERPEIVTAPAATTYGTTFAVTLDGIDSTEQLDSIVLIRPSATTHSFDATGRGIELEVIDNPAPGTFVVQSPPDALVANPGDYMLFVNAVHEDGPVPSVASWIHVE